MATPRIVDIVYKPWPLFKKHPHKSTTNDPIGGFSCVPINDFIHVKDVHICIHALLEEYNHIKIAEFKRIMSFGWWVQAET